MRRPPHYPTIVLARISTICDEFECYGYRRVRSGAAPTGRCGEWQEAPTLEAGARFAAKTATPLRRDDRQRPCRADLSDVAKDVAPDRPNQFWVADLTYVTIPGGFVYLAAILDAWSRKVVG